MQNERNAVTRENHNETFRTTTARMYRVRFSFMFTIGDFSLIFYSSNFFGRTTHALDKQTFDALFSIEERSSRVFLFDVGLCS